jgi:hypothetical protein
MLHVKQELLAGLRQALDGLLPDSGQQAVFENPKVAAHGDLAITAAMQLAKALKKNPREFGEQLRTALLALLATEFPILRTPLNPLFTMFPAVLAAPFTTFPVEFSTAPTGAYTREKRRRPPLLRLDERLVLRLAILPCKKNLFSQNIFNIHQYKPGLCGLTGVRLIVVYEFIQNLLI